MRSHAQAGSAGSIQGIGRCSMAAAAAALALLFLLTVGVAPALAGKGVAKVLGGHGTGDGQFQEVGGVAVDQSSGDLMASDVGGNRIQRLAADGTFISDFDSPELSSPRRLAVAPGGSVYVIDGENNYVVKYTAAGAFDSILGGPGSGAGELSSPFDVAVGPDGSVYVADADGSRVVKYTPAGAFVAELSRWESGPGELQFQRSVAVDSAGRLYVTGFDADFNMHVARFTAAGAFDQLFAPSEIRSPEDIAIDRSNDHVYLLQNAADFSGTVLAELDSAGNLIDTHAEGNGSEESFSAVAVAEATHTVYLGVGSNILVLGDVTPPEVVLDPVTERTAEGATLTGSVDPNGTEAFYRFEYSLDGSDWKRAPGTDVSVGAGDDPVPVSQQLNGLEVGAEYLVRLVARQPFNPPIVSPEVSFETPTTAPRVETAGSPYRTATTARLDGRVNPRGDHTTYYFEWGETTSYGSRAPVGADPAAGDGIRSVMVSQEIAGLEPRTTYHYRVVASNSSGTVEGEDRTVTTRSSDAPLLHGPLPGPPDSDRAWEQVSRRDTNGNPASIVMTLSEDGNRVVYGITGGVDGSHNGSGGFTPSPWFAERTANGWVSRNVLPDRATAAGPFWAGPGADRDLSQLLTWNGAEEAGLGASTDVVPSLWRIQASGEQTKLGELPLNAFPERGMLSSADASVFLIGHTQALDPDHPGPTLPNDFEENYLYDFGSGEPELVSLLPGDVVPPCGGAGSGQGIYSFPRQTSEHTMSARWISEDGSRLFFPALIECGNPFGPGSRLYMRDLDAGETTLISGPPHHGEERGGAFIKQTEDGIDPSGASAYFWTANSLVADDEGPNGDVESGEYDGGDVYRYDIAEDTHECLTCVAENADVYVEASNPRFGYQLVHVADDGSTIYFTSFRHLVPGEGTLPGEPGLMIYRVDVASGDLKVVGAAGSGLPLDGSAITPDGDVLVFWSANPRMNALTASDNGGVEQYYRYDDRSGSLICLTCQDDATYVSPVGDRLVTIPGTSLIASPMSADGETFVFGSLDPLLPFDQNTSPERPWEGNDIYEWRDGRLMLVTDGMSTHSPLQQPRLASVTPDGRNVFFVFPGELTREAEDAYQKVYTARIGGGFEVKDPPPPCSLEVCQGEATGPPADVVPGSATVSGPGDPQPRPAARKRKRRCGKARRRITVKGKSRCVAKPRRGRQGGAK